MILNVHDWIYFQSVVDLPFVTILQGFYVYKYHEIHEIHLMVTTHGPVKACKSPEFSTGWHMNSSLPWQRGARLGSFDDIWPLIVCFHSLMVTYDMCWYIYTYIYIILYIYKYIHILWLSLRSSVLQEGNAYLHLFTIQSQNRKRANWVSNLGCL